MAFYQDAPHQKRKVNPANQGSWDDEGSHYNKSSRPVHRFGPEAGQPVRGGHASNRNDYRDGRAFQGEGRGTRRNNRDSPMATATTAATIAMATASTVPHGTTVMTGALRPAQSAPRP